MWVKRKKNKVQPGKVSVTSSPAQKAMSSGGRRTTEVMAHPWRLVEDCSKHVQRWVSRVRCPNHLAFAVAGPSTWNSLPDSGQNPNATETAFRRVLKTFLFARLLPIKSWIKSNCRILSGFNGTFSIIRLHCVVKCVNYVREIRE